MKKAEDCNTVDEVLACLKELEEDPNRLVRNAKELEQMEQEFLEYTNRISALLLKKKIQGSVDSSDQVVQEKELMSGWPGRMKSEGFETVSIQLCTGSSVDIRVRYYRRSCDRRSRKRYKGAYAGLILLGIHDRCSPALASMVSSWSALLSSFEEVRQVLCDRGMTLDIKVIRKLTYRYAERARAEQQAGRIPLNDGDLLDGRRVVISTDGGRTRLREKKRGPKTQKDRTRFRGAWREPKLLIIYVVDAQGKQEKSFSPFIDGCFNGPDGVFHLLKGYLNSLHIQDSDKILFVADGAHWIWNRIPGLVKALGLDPERVYELLDFYHAVEHLGTVAGLRKTWSSKERKRWVSKQRGLLMKGKAVEVVQAVQVLCRGRNSKAIKTERDYFVRNERRLDFSTVKSLNLPIGSGAIESSIRRVVNLRLKGPCTFWYRENAEKMIMLRSFYKAGRWNCLKQMANTHNSMPAT